MKNKQFSQDKE